MTRFLSTSFIVSVAVVPLLIGCSRENPASDDAERAEEEGFEERISLTPGALESLDLQYANAARGELHPIVEVPAELVSVPDRRATIGSRVAGRVVAVHANVGDAVDADGALVELESHDVGRARADLIAAGARVEVARRAARRARQLREDRIGSDRAVEEAKGALDIARADLQAARARLRTYGVEEKAVSPDVPGHVVLSSPIAGTVIARRAHLGQWVEAADVLVEVVDLDALWLRGAVNESQLRYVAIGEPVDVEVRAYPGEAFTGTVDQIAGSLDERTRSIAVRIVLENPGHRLKPGMFATARIRGAVAASGSALTVPRSAVHDIAGRSAVFVREGDGAFEVRPVEMGQQAGDQVAIVRGLAEGEEVVTEGSLLLKGQALRETLAEEEE